MTLDKKNSFDMNLAKQCCDVFSGSTGIGCTISDSQGTILYESGFGYPTCHKNMNFKEMEESCQNSHICGMKESGRFGGKYIYLCPLGLTYFVSPIIKEDTICAKMTAGPILMSDYTEFVSCDLHDFLNLSDDRINKLLPTIKKVPRVSTEQVDKLSTLLFITVSFINNISDSAKLIKTQDSDLIQSQINTYVSEIKQTNEKLTYPFNIEKQLLHAISQKNINDAKKYLNELYGHIFFLQKTGFDQAKTRVHELLILISRAAIDSGANPDKVFELNNECSEKIPQIKNIDELCFWMTEIGNEYIDMVFDYVDVKHANTIHKAIQYVNSNYCNVISLEEMAKKVYLSPTYFSRVFKAETGMSFHSYLNKIRIDKSKELLADKKLRVIDIAMSLGFDDQSYFTKIFLKSEGMTPSAYRSKL